MSELFFEEYSNNEIEKILRDLSISENLDLKIISTFDVINQRKFENGKIPSNLFCKEVLFHITDE